MVLIEDFYIRSLYTILIYNPYPVFYKIFIRFYFLYLFCVKQKPACQSLAQRDSSVIRGDQVMDQHLQSVLLQSFLREGQKETVLEAAACQSHGPDACFLRDPEAGFHDQGSQALMEIISKLFWISAPEPFLHQRGK